MILNTISLALLVVKPDKAKILFLFLSKYAIFPSSPPLSLSLSLSLSSSLISLTRYLASSTNYSFGMISHPNKLPNY
jgi:hypothetical protein